MSRVTLDITGLGPRGEGLAHADAETIAVPFALPGERIVADVRDGQGTIVELVITSPERQPAACRHFTTCGGCSVQHLDIGAYRSWKLSLLTTALQRRGISGHEIAFIDAHGDGRRRVRFHARTHDGQAAIGFMAARSHSLIVIDVCPVLAPELAAAPRIAHSLATQFAAAEPTFDILLTATATGIDCDVRGLQRTTPWPDETLPRLLDRLAVVRLSLNGEPSITTAKPMVACGRAMVPLPPGGFLQATAAAERILADAVLKRTRRARNVADLFCGIGPFALRLAERRPVTAIDLDAEALAALDFAARHTQGLKPVSTHRRDLFREPLTIRELAAFDAVIFDPPRQGAEAQARQLAQSALDTVIALSCDAATFARDAAILVSGGYRMSQITVVDQFKWSSHLEIVAAFDRGLKQT